MKEGICAALVGCPGLLTDPITDELMLYKLICIGINPADIARQLVGLVIREAYCDSENAPLLLDSWNEEVDRVYLSRPDRRGQLPSLRARSREKELVPRQLTTMQPILQPIDGRPARLILAEDIKADAKLKAQMESWGRSIVADAVAGACQIAQEQYEILKANILREREIDAQGPTWFDMPRVRYDQTGK